jgi:hypothetical protein
MAWRDSVTETDFLFAKENIYLSMLLFCNRNRCCCSDALLINSHWYHGISFLTWLYRFWVELQNRSFELWLFCSHISLFPTWSLCSCQALKVRVAEKQTGSSSETAAYQWADMTRDLLGFLQPLTFSWLIGFYKEGYICTTPTVSSFSLAYTAML